MPSGEILEDAMRCWIVVALLLVSAGSTPCQEFRIVKSWTFALEHGSLRIELESSPDGTSSLGLGPNGQVLEAPVSEQGEPIRKVLEEMPTLGVDPHKVIYIGTRIFSSDVLKTLAYKCVDSVAWRESMRDHGRGKEKLIPTLLNQSEVYAPYSEVFTPYGLQVRVTEVEMVGLMKFSSVPPRDDHDRANGALLVPGDAMIGMRLFPIDDKKEER